MGVWGSGGLQHEPGVGWRQCGAPEGFSSPCGPTRLPQGKNQRQEVGAGQSWALGLAVIFGKFLLAGPLCGLLGGQ